MLSILISILITSLFGTVVSGNILGDMKKQIGKKIVYAKWKGIQYFRTYVSPSNPQSVRQTAQRTLFKTLVDIGSFLNYPLLKDAWRPFAVKKSQFNAWTQDNLKAMFPTFDPSKMIITKGNLFPTSITSAVYNESSGEITVTHPTSAVNNQSLSDYAFVVVYDTENNRIDLSLDSGKQRQDNTVVFSIGMSREVSQLSCYLFFANDLIANNPSLISNSYYSAVTAA